MTSARADDALLFAVMIREAIVGFLVLMVLLMAKRVLGTSFAHSKKRICVFVKLFS